MMSRANGNVCIENKVGNARSFMCVTHLLSHKMASTVNSIPLVAYPMHAVFLIVMARRKMLGI